MTAYKCDCCGNFFEMKCAPDVRITRFVCGRGEKRLDLCRKCYRKLIDWFNFKDKNELIEQSKRCYKKPTD